MHILVSNDDGIFADGLIHLVSALESAGNDVTVVAPHRERSAASHCITLHKPLRIKEIKPRQFAVTGTPADCVYMATRHLLKQKPDLVISGINRGENLGDSVFYSGTVAAAREGALFGVPSIAMSLCTNQSTDKKNFQWQTACEFIKKFLPHFVKTNPSHHVYWNINVPNVMPTEIRGVRLAHQGKRFYKDMVTESVDPRNKKYYWIGGNYAGHDDMPLSDCNFVNENYISIVPLKIDQTDESWLKKCKEWESFF